MMGQMPPMEQNAALFRCQLRTAIWHVECNYAAQRMSQLVWRENALPEKREISNMKVFHCENCDLLAFFENRQCVKCGREFAFDAEALNLKTLNKDSQFRLCENGLKYQVCNWAAPMDDPNPFCRSCQLTRVIPKLSEEGALAAWTKLEAAKRRLVYGLLSLALPVGAKTDGASEGLAFEFLADPPAPDAQPILTGHAQGVITINIAEANDAEREKRRLSLGETYRTLLGHFRHEVGHYYWDLLIAHSGRIDDFRILFGDERADYAAALKKHYDQGAAANWNDRYVSSYASSHPWEDWAETWAHYMHMVDALETAFASGLTLKPNRRNEPALNRVEPKGKFDDLINAWYPLTCLLNNLNRGIGLADGYPFVLSAPVVDKLRFVHHVVTANNSKTIDPMKPLRAHSSAAPAKGVSDSAFANSPP